MTSHCPDPLHAELQKRRWGVGGVICSYLNRVLFMRGLSSRGMKLKTLPYVAQCRRVGAKRG